MLHYAIQIADVLDTLGPGAEQHHGVRDPMTLGENAGHLMNSVCSTGSGHVRNRHVSQKWKFVSLEAWNIRSNELDITWVYAPICFSRNVRRSGNRTNLLTGIFLASAAKLVKCTSAAETLADGVLSASTGGRSLVIL